MFCTFQLNIKKTYKTKMNFIRELVQYQLQWWASMTAVICIHYSETTFLFIAIYITAHSYSQFIVHHLFSFMWSTKVIHQRIQKNIVIFTIKYIQCIVYIDTHRISCKPQHFLTKNKWKSLKIKNIWILLDSILVTATLHVNFTKIYEVE
jgi:hypothetical protein